MRKEIGIISVGQAGGNIGYLFEKKGFDVIYLNSSIIDLNTINTTDNKKYHFQNGIGTAKDRSRSKELLKNDYSNIFAKIDRELGDKKFYYIVFSTGGGTGSGASPMLANLLIEHLDKKVGLITILPSENETLQTHINAYECFQEISKIEGLGSCLVIDNNIKLNILEINKRFVSLFDKIFDYEKYENEQGNFDKSEIVQFLNTEGAMIVASCKKNKTTKDLIGKIKKGMFAPIENDGKIKYLGLFKSIRFDYEMFKSEIGNYVDKFESISSDNTIAILSGLTLPFTRLLKIKEGIQKNRGIMDKFNEKKENPLDDIDFLKSTNNEVLTKKGRSVDDIFNGFFM